MDETLFTAPRPTADRPLLGLTVLVVEDSRLASEAMRLLCMRSGARIRRADSLRAARRHLSLYRPGVIVIDVGLPDGSGLELLGELSRALPRVQAILAISGDPGMEQAALAAGADGFLVKPILSLDQFQQAILSRLSDWPQPSGLRLLAGEIVSPDEAAFHDDLALVADLLGNSQTEDRLGYVSQFLEGLAVQAGDGPLKSAAEALRVSRESGRAWGPDLARVAGLVRSRLEQRRAV